MIFLTLNEFDNDKDCPELYNAFNTSPVDCQTGLEDASFPTLTTGTVDPKDADELDEEDYPLFLAYGDSFGD